MFNKKVAVVQLDEGELEKALLASGSFANKLRINICNDSETNKWYLKVRGPVHYVNNYQRELKLVLSGTKEQNDRMAEFKEETFK